MVSCGSVWATGGIRVRKAIWVVILLNSMKHRSAGFSHSELCFYLLGNLNPFFVFVASLEGDLTILATSAFAVWELGFYVLWGSTNRGVIRKGAASVFRTFFLLPLYTFCTFLVPCSDSQSWLIWFLCGYYLRGWKGAGCS
ncbi:hypothetical protein Hanom_Chr01g00029681 [Helianthus anomalus]